MPEPLLNVGDVAMLYDLRLYRVVEVDKYGFCTLMDREGETGMRHQSCADFADVFLRASATCLPKEFSQ